MKKIFVMCILIVLIIAGCSKVGPVQKENIKLSIGAPGEIREDLQTAINNAFPNYEMTYEILLYNEIESLYEEKKLPDIILDTDFAAVPPHLRDKFYTDLSPYISSENVDLTQFPPALLERNSGENGELYGLPVQRLLTALFYNKAPFDAFDIPYPTDGMTWDDVILLASQFSDFPNGSKYVGLDLLSGGGLQMLLDQFNVTVLDPQTDQFKSSSELLEVVQKIDNLYEKNGNRPTRSFLIYPDGFLKHGTTAMYLGVLVDPIVLGAANNQDIDLVTFPRVDAISNIGSGTRTVSLHINSESKNKESAFEIIKYLVSDELQKYMVENGSGTVLNEFTHNDNFGKNIPELQNKNLKALFEMDLPELDRPSIYEGIAYVAAAPLLAELIMGTKSVDDVMDKMESAVNDAVIAAKAKEVEE
ncbi:carbohydrate ABC transporter substrate-binding protein [Paenibacillus sp. 1011MAR3C5]|uniref:ABC transporter substrate-binding protein n=1 Tax=Paenibacillus sp. 1011MAR3C5 TaxID=1675787 RepID=UPI000E6B8F71|nr:ABC transporter substrate-binding protein [Paenibacillus sp. 1011MAR3C5]RJE90817.1 carbohydrate ABC transporter substrate-binding protein [Paenibacillus sp. 1011MAR3C5]